MICSSLERRTPAKEFSITVPLGNSASSVSMEMLCLNSVAFKLDVGTVVGASMDVSKARFSTLPIEFNAVGASVSCAIADGSYVLNIREKGTLTINIRFMGITIADVITIQVSGNNG